MEDAYRRGIRVWRICIPWDLYEPLEGYFDRDYILKTRDYVRTIREAGLMSRSSSPSRIHLPGFLYTLVHDSGTNMGMSGFRNRPLGRTLPMRYSTKIFDKHRQTQ